jgi:hypothetical protein
MRKSLLGRRRASRARKSRNERERVGSVDHERPVQMIRHPLAASPIDRRLQIIAGADERSERFAAGARPLKADALLVNSIVPDVVGLKTKRHKYGRGPDPLLDVERFQDEFLLAATLRRTSESG